MGIKINWDALGIATSIACAIHCAVLPLFLISLPILGADIINNKPFEYGMIVLAFSIGCIALYHGIKKHHHNITPLLIFIVGMICLVLKEGFNDAEVLLLIPAIILIIWAHYMNYRLCRKANHCHNNDCNH
ncbi:MAG TPA: MerC domain-containing protein [Chitinophagaceae bacterium]|nr:MerC domain-containing protein [Chitinophagaceae bacterium]